MAKFLAVHTLPNPMTVEETTAIGKAGKGSSTLDAYWVDSWCQLNDEHKIVKILCQWNATSAEAVRDAITRAQIPCDGVYPMMRVDAEDFR